MVRVSLSKKAGRYGNHRPEFRPTETDKLFAAEKLIAAAVEKVMNRPVDADALIYDRVSAAQFRIRLLDRAIDEDVDTLRRAIFAAYQLGAGDAVAQTRADVNDRLAKLRSPARLVSGNTTRKAETVAPVWDVVIESFDVVDPNAPAAVFSRFEAGEVLAGMAADTEAAIGALIENGFTASQTWASTGRTSHGLTPDDIGRSLFAVLNDERAAFTGASYASELSDPARGLFPRWAQAVEKTGNQAAYRAMRAGATPAQAAARATAEMERHGTKLRRARARMIARTETARAQNAAIADGHRRAVDEGLVGADTEMEWITGPFDVCPICTPLGGTRVPIKGGESFPTATGFPPAHPSCRCKTRLVPDIGTPPRRIGEGSREDPYRYQFEDGWVAPINPTNSTNRAASAASTASPGGAAAARLDKFPDSPTGADLHGAAVLKRDAKSQKDWVDNVAPWRVADAKRTGLYDDIAANGITKPVDVFVRPPGAMRDGGPRFELSTGHHRVAVANDLGINVPVRYYGSGYRDATGKRSSR